MQKNKRYYIGKILNFIKNKIPKLYNALAGKKGIKRVIFDSLIKYYKDTKKNLVKEVKSTKKSKETVKPEIVKE